MRGLLWQPARINLYWEDIFAVCDSCRRPADSVCVGFYREKFTYNLVGFFWHPHSPVYRFFNDQNQEVFAYSSFRETAPTWTQLNSLVLSKKEKKEQFWPALVVAQYQEIFAYEPLNLIIGGYINNQAAVKQRRYEIISLPSNLNKQVLSLIDLALEIKNQLIKKFYIINKTLGIDLTLVAEKEFYQDTETLVYQLLANSDQENFKLIKRVFIGNISDLTVAVFERLTQPYFQAERIKTILLTKKQLEKYCNKILEEGTS